MGGGGGTPAVVRLDVTNVDDYLYVTVNGIRRKVTPLFQDVVNLDVSSWFFGGTNTVRIQAIDRGAPASYSFQLRVDGQVVSSESCANAPCEPVAGGAGILFDRTYQVSTPNRPAARTLTVNGPSGSRIYLNDAYTGFSAPRSFTLPQGSYMVGLGVGEGSFGAYTGQFYEQTVQLAAGPVTVNPAQGTALNFPNHTRIALLPIRQTIHGAGGPANTGILAATDVTNMQTRIAATNQQWVRPFSYGLTTWDVDVLPIVENTALVVPDPDSPPQTGEFLAAANLTSLRETYDIIFFLYSEFTASGALVATPPCCWWGGGQEMMFKNGLAREVGQQNQPTWVILHEAMHCYDSYNQDRLHYYVGADGTHGGGVHAYDENQGGEPDFLMFLRHYMRNQVAELNTMRSQVPTPRRRR